MANVISEYGTIVNGGGDTIQYQTMPTANESNLNKVVQYIGNTTATYTNGYFYKCVKTQSNPDVYGWEQIDVQPHQSISGKADKVANATNGNFAALDASGNLTDSGKKASDFVLTTAIGTAATKDVPTSGNASTTQVVMGNDTRLSDSRPASDVSAWAKASTKPTYTASEVGAAASSHNQAASTITAGTLAGRVQANASAAGTLSNAQVRDITISTTDLTPGTSALATGALYVVYE